MANGENPRGPRVPLIQPVPIILVQELETPKSTLDEERERVNRFLRTAGQEPPAARVIDSLEGQALYFLHCLPRGEGHGLREFVAMKAQEMKYLMYFLHQAKWRLQHMKLDRKAHDKIRLFAAELGEERLFIDGLFFEKAVGTAEMIEDGIVDKGLKFIMEVKGDGVSLTQDFMAVIEEAFRAGGKDLNEQLGRFSKAVQELMMRRGIDLTEDNFKTVFLNAVEAHGRLDPPPVSQERSRKNHLQQRNQIQRFVNMIPQRMYFPSDTARGSEQLEQIFDDMRDKIVDTNEYLQVLGMRQKVYEKFNRSLNGREIWMTMAAANSYLVQSYLVRYVLWLLKGDSEGNEAV